MTQETIEKIISKIQSAETIRPESKAELLALLAELKVEVTKLSRTHGEQAVSITSFADLSAHEATRQAKNPQLLQLSLEGLSSSTKEFEISHPRLVEIANALSLMLSNSGV
ncbi:MAG: hypothetical protein U0V70_03965 [Terriglobia bacterium]